MKKGRKALIILGISIALTLGFILLSMLDTEPNPHKQLSIMLLPIWFFSFAPSYVFAYDYLKKRNFFQAQYNFHAMRLLMFVGFWVPLVIAPILMVLFYVNLL